MDLIDLANDAVAACLADAERRARGRSAPETHPDFDGCHCVECGGRIPWARLGLGRVRCVSCQEDLEKLVRMEPLNRRAEDDA